MKLNQPTKIVFLICLIAAILACVVLFAPVSIPYITGAIATYILVGAFFLLAASCVLKGV